MIIKTIASSSKGNCYTLSDLKSTIMIEAGGNMKRIREGVNFKLSEISGCVVSHAHL